MSNERLGLTSVVRLVALAAGNAGAGGLGVGEGSEGGVTEPGADVGPAGANKNLFMLAKAINSFSSRSLSDFISLKRLRLRSSDPFSNMSRAAG